MAHLLVHRHMGVYPAAGGEVLVLHELGQAQQNAHGQLVVQEAALDIAGSGDPGPGLEADDVAHLHTQSAGIIGGLHVLVQHRLAGVIAALGVGIFAVDVDGGVAQLEGALDDPPGAGVDPDVLRLAVFRTHTAQSRQPQAAISLDLRHHAAQGVGMGLQQQAVILVAAAQVDENAALDGGPGLIAQGPEGVQHPLRRLPGEARGAVDGQQLHRLVGGIFRIGTFHS